MDVYWVGNDGRIGRTAQTVARSRRSAGVRGLLCCTLLALTLLPAWAEPPALVEGIQSWQVFPRQGKVGATAFRARSTGTLVAELFRSGENAAQPASPCHAPHNNGPGQPPAPL